MANFHFFYSDLKQITGSFLAAILEGIQPDKNVNPIEIKIKTRAARGLRFAIFPICTSGNRLFNIKLIGTHKI